MITEDYVSFEIAKLLKEKGFNEELDMVYSQYGDLHKVFDLEYYNATCEFSTVSNSHYNDITRIKYDFFATAPTLQMAMKWLKEIHDIYYDVKLLLGDKAAKYGDLQLGVYQISDSGAYRWEHWLYADTYEELYEKYIKYCLEHLV